MSVQEYIPYPGGMILADGFEPEHKQTYVLTSDHQSSLAEANAALAARELRIKLLEDAIRDALNDSETGDGWGPDVTVAGKLRAALATEGEKR